MAVVLLDKRKADVSGRAEGNECVAVDTPPTQSRGAERELLLLCVLAKSGR